jgi:hypothetical protein
VTYNWGGKRKREGDLGSEERDERGWRQVGGQIADDGSGGGMGGCGGQQYQFENN